MPIPICKVNEKISLKLWNGKVYLCSSSLARVNGKMQVVKKYVVIGEEEADWYRFVLKKGKAKPIKKEILALL